jgi:glycosyltransferase involved in cell wall biosynthesis
MPKISIITVVFNGAKTIEHTIISVLNQTYRDFEYIIVDGRSSDDTLKIIKKYDHSIKWISEQDNGVYDAMNKAITLCNGEWIYFLGADDTLFSNQILQDVSRFLTRSNIIFYGNVRFLSSGRIYDGKFSGWKMVTRNISHQAIFYPRSVFTDLRFEPKYKVFADYALNLKLYGNNKYVFYHAPLIIAIFNDNGISGSGTKDLEFRADMASIIRENLSWPFYFYRRLRTFFVKMAGK